MSAVSHFKEEKIEKTNNKKTSQSYSWAEIGFNYQQVNEKLLHEEHKLLSASIIRRQRTFLANYTFSAEPCLFKFRVDSLSSYLVTTGELHFFFLQPASQRFSAGFFLLFPQCCVASWSCVLFFGWRSQLDLWEGWVSYCLSCCVLMECRNLYASFRSSFIAIDFWLSPLPVLKGDVEAEKMSVSQ